MAAVEKQLAKHTKTARSGGDKEAATTRRRAREGARRCSNEGRPARTADLYDEEMAVLQPLLPADGEADDVRRQRRRSTAFDDNPLLRTVEAHAAKEGAPVVAVCAAIEAEIADLDDEDKADVPRGHGH